MCLVSGRRLTEALLYLDFNISLTLPDNRLCPPVSCPFLVGHIALHLSIGAEQVRALTRCELWVDKRSQG